MKIHRTNPAFRKLIFEREQGRCLLCGQVATDLCHLTHYGMGRRRDSGLEDRMDNAFAGCRWCHIKQHTGEIKTENIKKLIGG